MNEKTGIAILGTGNLGSSIANGLAQSGYAPENVVLTRRRAFLLDGLKERGFVVTDNNVEAVGRARTVIVAVEPQQIDVVLDEIRDELDPEKHIVISVVTAVTIDQITQHIGQQIPIVRAMPNTAIAVRESMTCLASNGLDSDAVARAESIFDTVGKTLQVSEEEMIGATALGACGIAFFLRAVRAASQGGIEIGFHADVALEIAAQTAKGAATLLLSADNHPEREIDKVTTPRGCTIAGLNEMEHQGFSSSMIRGIKTAATKAEQLYLADE